MGIINSMQKGFKSWFDQSNNANFLFVTAALGWALASISQTFGLVKNKELTKEDKKFLIPQEIADGIANIGMYAIVTTNMMKGAEKLLKPGKKANPFVQLKDASGNILDYKTHLKEYTRMGENFKTGAAIAGGIISTCILTPIVRNAFGALIKKEADQSNDGEQKQIPLEIYDGRTQPYFTQTYTNTFTPIAQKQTMVKPAFYNTTGMKI